MSTPSSSNVILNGCRNVSEALKNEGFAFPAQWISDIIYLESSYRHDLVNKIDAVGYLQWIPSTRKSFGWTKQEIINAGPVGQFDYVFKYLLRELKSKKKSPTTFIDAYCLVFYPVWFNKPKDATMSASAFKHNQFYDVNQDGIGTKGEFETTIKNRLGKKLITFPLVTAAEKANNLVNEVKAAFAPDQGKDKTDGETLKTIAIRLGISIVTALIVNAILKAFRKN